MKSRILSLAAGSVALALVMTAASSSKAQNQNQRLEFPAASPAASLKQRVGLTDIEVAYSRPGAKGRKIYGSLVPYGAVWRTGANASTKISFSTDVILNGAPVPAGKYALYTIPGEKEWTVIIYKDTSLGGSVGYNPSNDLVRVKTAARELPEFVETFSIGINDIRDESATLNIDWEKTRVPVKIEMPLKEKLAPRIESAMAEPGGRKPYYQAAMFYYDHNLDAQKAKQWIEAAAAEREAYYILHLKAKILARIGDKEGAAAAARRSTELAVAAEGPSSGYVKMNSDLIAGLR